MALGLITVCLVACNGLLGASKNNVGSHGGPGGPYGNGGGDPGPSLARRLTRFEYVNTITKLFGVGSATYLEALPADVVLDGFDNSPALQTMTSGHVTAYQNAAMAVADVAIQNSATLNALAGCDLSGAGETCLRQFTTRMGRQVFRRTLENSEVDALVTLAKTESDALQRVAVVIGATLQSPSFLYRFEVGTPDASRPKLLKLTGLELAARLSFLLLGHSPSAELMDSAERGGLDTPEGVEAATRTLIAEGTPKQSFRHFFDQWFRFTKLTSLPLNPSYSSSFSATVATAAHDEVYKLIDDHVWAVGSNFFNLYTSSHGYINAALAPLYGVTAPGQGVWNKHSFDNDANRGGLFSTPAFLAVTSTGGDTSKISRGVFTRHYLLCEHLQTPPGGANPAIPLSGEPIEETLRRHASDPSCAGCHARIDPIGDGLERYDRVGKLRAKYASGNSAVLPGSITGLAEPNFEGAKQFGVRIAASEQAKECLVRQLFRYTFGRIEFDEDVDDKATFESLHDAAEQANYNFADLLIAFVKTDAFRYRRDPAFDGGK